MRRATRLSSPFLGAACLLAGLCGCSGQGAVSTPAPAAVVAPGAPQAKEAPPKQGARAGAPAQQAGPGSSAPLDRGGKLVARLLEPTDAVLAAEARRARGPRDLPAAPSLEAPQLPLPPYTGELPRLPAPSGGASPRPGSLGEGTPLDRYRADPPPPAAPQLPAAGLVRLPSPDLNRPVPLPILAGPVTDRAPLTDPTPDVSLAAVLAEPVPVRTTPAPFVRLNLPDPFEHAQAARLRTPPEEDPHPPVTFPQPPTK
jgi:hypothetical protein